VCLGFHIGSNQLFVKPFSGSGKVYSIRLSVRGGFLYIASMTKITSLCVFCGSKNGDDPAHAVAARQLGEQMAARGITLVYGGGSIGLMGIIADAVMAGGGRVIGVIPQFLKDLEVGNDNVSELIVTDSMHARKTRMFELSDGFVALPGGLGTLDETLEILTWKQLQLHTKPVVVLSTGGYWDALEALVSHTINGGFTHEAVAELYTVVATADAVFPALGAQPEPKEEVLTSHL